MALRAGPDAFPPVPWRYTDVPESQGVQAFDRYGYSANNPLRYRDPSGHLYCDSEYAAEDICNGWTGSGAEFEMAYSVEFNGDFTANERSRIAWGIYIAGLALGNSLGVNSPAEAFSAAFGTSAGDPLKLVKQNSVTDNNGNNINAGAWTAGSHTIYFLTGGGSGTWNTQPEDNPLAFVALHELGHAFNARMANVYGEDAHKTPYERLKFFGIFADGKKIAGSTYRGSQYGYGAYIRTDYGYQTPGFIYQQNHWTDTANEDFADMYMNWVLGSFTNDAYGQARDAWMNSWMYVFTTDAAGS